LAEDKGTHLLRRRVASLSAALYTPIPYFLSLPIRELDDWFEAAKANQEKR